MQAMFALEDCISIYQTDPTRKLPNLRMAVSMARRYWTLPAILEKVAPIPDHVSSTISDIYNTEET